MSRQGASWDAEPTAVWPVTIAHVSDLHLGAHDPEAVRRLVADVAAARPTVTVVTGDLTMRARAGQFRAVAALLDRLPEPRLTVPGNHDLPLDRLVTRLLAPHRGYLSAVPGDLEPVLDVPGLRVVGLASTPRWRWKSGRIGRRQCAHVRRALGTAPLGTAPLGTAPPGTVRVLAMHHPVTRHGWLGMAGRGRLLDALAAARVDLVLAGHTHVPATRRLDAPGGRHRFIEVVAGTATSHRVRGNGQSWTLITISPSAVVVEHRRCGAGRPGRPAAVDPLATVRWPPPDSLR